MVATRCDSYACSAMRRSTASNPTRARAGDIVSRSKTQERNSSRSRYRTQTAASNSTSFAEGWDLSGSIKKPKLHVEMMPWCTFDEKITVATKRLDTWAREYDVERA